YHSPPHGKIAHQFSGRRPCAGFHIMHSFGSAYRAVVVGASGAIGQAFVRALASDPNCVNVIGVSRRSHPGFSLESETSMAQVARELHEHGPFELIIDATGALTLNGQGPEKHL